MAKILIILVRNENQFNYGIETLSLHFRNEEDTIKTTGHMIENEDCKRCKRTVFTTVNEWHKQRLVHLIEALNIQYNMKF